MSRRTKQASVRRLRPSCSCMSDVQHAAQCGVNAFIPLKHVTARLQQYCAVCGQWVASHRCMKRHYQYSHKNLLEELGTEIQRLIHRTATACPTCHFCNVRCKDWRTHVQKCTVAWQCAILHLRERRRRAKPVLRDATLGTTGGTPTKAPPPITDSRPQRATKGPSIVDYSSSTRPPAGALVVFLKPGEHNILHHLFQTAKAFQAKQQSNPTWTPGHMPLKTVMAIALFQELRVRLERTCQEEALAAKIQERGW